jgi:hypothetical protein
MISGKYRNTRHAELRCSEFTPLSTRGEFGIAQVSIANESDQVNEGHSVDALAVRGYEGRGTLR